MALSPTPTSASGLTIVNPPKLFDPSAFGYSQAVIAPAGSRTAFISGQGGADHTGSLSPDFATQVEQAFQSLGLALEGAGTDPAAVTRLTIYVVDHDPSKLTVITQQVVAMFGATLPAQTLVPVPRLALDGMLFEVDAIAVVQ